MSETLERVTTEVRKLTPDELKGLRAWLAEYEPAANPLPADTGKPVDWSGHSERMKAIWGDTPPLAENAVLSFREEERY